MAMSVIPVQLSLLVTFCSVATASNQIQAQMLSSVFNLDHWVNVPVFFCSFHISEIIPPSSQRHKPKAFLYKFFQIYLQISFSFVMRLCICVCTAWIFCMCEHMYVWVCVYMVTYAYSGLRLIPGIILCSSTVIFGAESLIQSQSLSIWLVSLASLLWGSPVSTFRGCNYRQATVTTWPSHGFLEIQTLVTYFLRQAFCLPIYYKP